MMTVPDCGDCPQTDCTDHGKPPNERSRSAEECAEVLWMRRDDALRNVLESYDRDLVPLQWDGIGQVAFNVCVKTGLLEHDAMQVPAIGGMHTRMEFRISNAGRDMLAFLLREATP